MISHYRNYYVDVVSPTTQLSDTEKIVINMAVINIAKRRKKILRKIETVLEEETSDEEHRVLSQPIVMDADYFMSINYTRYSGA